MKTIERDKENGTRTNLFIDAAKKNAISIEDVEFISSRKYRFFTEAETIEEKISNNDHYKFWWNITSPVRFHRIKQGKASSFISKLGAHKDIHQHYIEEYQGTDFNIGNIWYYFIPFLGEAQFFEYKYGPNEFFRNPNDYLWKFLFENFNVDELFFSDVKPYLSGPKEFEYSPFLLSEIKFNPYMSGEEICKVMLVWAEENINVKEVCEFGWWYKFSIAAIRISNTENQFRSHNQKFSRKLLEELFSGENIFTNFCDQIGQKNNLKNHLKAFSLT